MPTASLARPTRLPFFRLTDRATLVVIATVVALAACGGGGTDEEADGSSNGTATTLHWWRFGDRDSVRVLALTNRESRRLSRSIVEYTFDAVVQNKGVGVGGARLLLESVGSGTTVVKGVIGAGDLPARSTARVRDAVVIRHDHSIAPLKLSKLRWRAVITQRILSTVSQAASTPITLPNVATWDFTGSPILAGERVSVHQVVDAAANKLAGEQASSLRVVFPDATTIRASVSFPPSAPVAVSVNVTSLLAAAGADRLPVVYVLTEAADGDGEDSWLPIVGGSIDRAAGIFSGTIGLESFRIEQAGTSYAATIRVGLASVIPALDPPVGGARLEGSSKAATEASRRLAALLAPGVVFPCPIEAGCTETSMFNPLRSLPAKVTTRKGHSGMDIRAGVGTPVFLPPGGKPLTVFTELQYFDFRFGTNFSKTNDSCAPYKDSTGVECLQFCLPSLTDCVKLPESMINGGAGVSLTVEYGSGETAYAIRFIHLEAIDRALVLSQLFSGTNWADTSFTTNGGQIGNTGATGVAAATSDRGPQPHLHAVLLKYAPSASVRIDGRSYSLFAPVDPFPYMVARVDLKQTAGPQGRLEVGQRYAFEFSAADVNGRAISSEQGRHDAAAPPSDAVTNYSPSRKVCLESSAPAVLSWPPEDAELYFRNVSEIAANAQQFRSCVPWNKQAGHVAMATAAEPEVTLSAQFSVEPRVGFNKDPLSASLDPRLRSPRVTLASASSASSAYALSEEITNRFCRTDSTVESGITFNWRSCLDQWTLTCVGTTCPSLRVTLSGSISVRGRGDCSESEFSSFQTVPPTDLGWFLRPGTAQYQVAQIGDFTSSWTDLLNAGYCWFHYQVWDLAYTVTDPKTGMTRVFARVPSKP